MKKYLGVLFLIVTSIFFASNPHMIANASSTFSYETIYPDIKIDKDTTETILSYQNLDNINKISVNNTHIAFTTDNTNLKIFDITTKNYYQISNFTYINDIKFTKNHLLVATDNDIKIINTLTNNTADNLISLTDIHYNNFKCIDFYVDDNNINIGLIDNNTFKLYKYNSDLQATTSNPILTNNNFANSYMLAVNNQNAYIITDKNDPIINILNLDDNSFASHKFKQYSEIIETFIIDSKEYLITFTKETLHFLDAELNDIGSGLTINYINEPLNISDFDIYNNIIYACDSHFGDIQTFKITPEITIKSDKILISSNNSAKGRFDNTKDIFVQGNILGVADTNNDRIQIIKDNDIKEIKLDTKARPYTIKQDKYTNILTLEKKASTTILTKYNYRDNYGTKTTYNISANISDLTINNNNEIILLDSDNSKMLYHTSTGTENKRNLDFTLSVDSQIEYIILEDKYIIYSNENLYLLDNNGLQLHRLNVGNINSLSSDLNGVYILKDDKLYLVNIINNQLSINTNTIENDYLSKLSSCFYDIPSRKMYAFDNDRQCLINFNVDIGENHFNFTSLEDTPPISNINEISGKYITSNTIIYEYPYEQGICYNQDNTISKCITIGEYGDYYRIIFNHKDRLVTGFIKKTSTTPAEEINYNSINVIANEQTVSIYKFPTVLKHKNNSLKIGTLPIRTKITLRAIFPISIDGKTMYLYHHNNQFGFIFGAEVVKDDVSNIGYLNVDNAEINTVSEDIVPVYSDITAENKIFELHNSDRIFVENYNKKSEYTKVVYITPAQESVEGYVKTEYIQMDKIETNTIIIIIIIVISIILLSIIIICYFKTKNRNK